MNRQTAKNKQRTAVKPASIHTLELPAGDLRSMHAGLTERAAAWRNAHDAATARLGALIERADAILERVAQKH